MLLNKIKNMQKNNVIIGFTASTFDLLHPGHIDMISQAKSKCDFLIIGLLTDPTISRDFKDKPVESTFERWMRIQAIDDIDMIIPFDTEKDLENMIKVIKPDIRFVGIEYKGTKHTGYDLTNIIYNDRDHNWSSRSLKDRLRD